MKKLAIMQPYFFPYIGYFQLIKAVDRFVFYDDVNYIKQGWINRNRILLRGKTNYITIPVSGASQWKKIYEIDISHDPPNWRKKLLALVTDAYFSSPYFTDIFPLFKKTIEQNHTDIGEIAKASIMATIDYLGLDVNIVATSRNYNNAELKGKNRILDICQKEGADEYINAPGGINLYDSADFINHGLKLKFLQPLLLTYSQKNDVFIPGLSILDVIMNNSVNKTKELIYNYSVASPVV